ncbi:MAG: Tex family protein [Bacteroidia bacterium]
MFIQFIQSQISVPENQILAAQKLFDEGATIPFIARYRKEKTGGLDEVELEKLQKAFKKYDELESRKKYILQTIEEQGKLSNELKMKISSCMDEQVLEDLYLPYKVKRKTKAVIAREKGLEPLAEWLLKEQNGSIDAFASKFINDKVASIEEALQGAKDIIAELINENIEAREIIRNQFKNYAIIYSKLVKKKEAEASSFRDYFDSNEKLNQAPSHRVLAMFRGEEEGFLKISIEPNEEICLDKLDRFFIKRNTESSEQIRLALEDSYKRLLAPSIENETRANAKLKADKEAIDVFAENLKQLLLSSPLGRKRILAIDPGIRTGCKVVCLNEEGTLLHHTVIYPFEPRNDKQGAAITVQELVKRYQIQAIGIGNGTAGRETESLVRGIRFENTLQVFLVNESGASIYSASEIAREEFPDLDLTVRGAISIGRRLADPLAELVKIDPKSIGVGQYQHDVNQNQLKESLNQVVLNCVNKVGVHVNTASKSLLTYVSGIGPQLAQNIIEYRNEKGGFKSRNELKKVARLGDKAFEQCAGFLRIPESKHILDNTAVHPEAYGIVESMAKDLNCKIEDLIKNESLRKSIQINKYISTEFGLPSIKDIIEELAKPGRDPREKLEEFQFANIKKPEDLEIGMIVPGIVTNITKFGCFVDIGVKQDGMVHISQMADRFIKDPAEVVKLQQHVQVKIIELDLVRKRISLSMKIK